MTTMRTIMNTNQTSDAKGSLTSFSAPGSQTSSPTSSGGSVRLAFFGTDPLAADTLHALEAAGFSPALVIASPDKTLSRGARIVFPIEKQWALDRAIPVMQPHILDDAFMAQLRSEPWDVFVVASYGKIISRAILNIPRKGVVNLHPSLLPRLRGPSPIRSAILNDEKEVGVSIMLLDEKMDHGPILAQEKVTLPAWPIPGRALDTLLSQEGAKLLAATLPRWISGDITPREQDHNNATFTKIFTKDMAQIDLNDDPRRNLLKIKAFDGWPGTFTFFQRGTKSIRVVIEDAHLEGKKLVLDRVKPEGKQSMAFQDFERGLRI